MVKISKMSKRQPLSQRSAIEKKAQSHRKLIRKLARKNKKMLRPRRRRLAKIEIPNECPFKNDIVTAMEVDKLQYEAGVRIKKEERIKKKAVNRLLKKVQMFSNGQQQVPADLLDDFTKMKLSPPTVLDNISTESGAEPDTAENALYPNLSISMRPMSKKFISSGKKSKSGKLVLKYMSKNKEKMREDHKSVGDGKINFSNAAKSLNKASQGKKYTFDAVKTPLGANIADIISHVAQLHENTMNHQKKHISQDSAHADIHSTVSSHKAFKAHVDWVVGNCDIIIQVLDARYPNISRCEKLEELIAGKSKSLIFLLNKIDLVPADVLQSWLRYLRKFHPTIPFKCLTGKSATGAGMRVHHSKQNPLQASVGQLAASNWVFGSEKLLQLLKLYSKNRGENVGERIEAIYNAQDQSDGEEETINASANDFFHFIKVGIIGYPNVGKSSVINSLRKRSLSHTSKSAGQACSSVKIGGEAGITRHIQEIPLHKHITLVDSPGVVFDRQGENSAEAILSGSVKLQSIANPELVIPHLLALAKPSALSNYFKVSESCCNDSEQFLTQVGKRNGKLIKKGQVDLHAAAVLVLNAWITGAVPFYTLPPAVNDEISVIR